MSLLIQGGLVLAAAEAQPIAADVLVEGDRIVRVGPNLEAGPAVTILAARDCLVMPGLVNAHTHAHNHLARSLLDRLPLDVWLQQLMARVVNRTPRDIYVGAAIGAIEMARTGTTGVCEMAQVLPWPTDETLDAVAQAYADVGLRVQIAPQMLDLPFYEGLAGLAELLPSDIRAEVDARPTFPRDEVLATLERTIDRWNGAADGRISFGVGPTIALLCSTEFLEACGRLASERGLVLQTHLAEAKSQAYTAQLKYGQTFTARLHELGLLGPRTLLAHAVWLDQRDVELIAASGASVAHNPVCNVKVGSGIAPLLELREAGVNVALGTDGSASNDNQNLFGVIKLAAILQRVGEPNFERWPTAVDVLRMATTNGARAAGFGDQVGRIRVGDKADLVLLDLRQPHFHPTNNLPDQLVFAESGGSVRTVVVDGRVIVDDGRVATADEQALWDEADEIARRVAREVEGPLRFARRVEPFVRQAYFAAIRAELPINRYSTDRYRSI